jgi:hypothetical protein
LRVLWTNIIKIGKLKGEAPTFAVAVAVAYAVMVPALPLSAMVVIHSIGSLSRVSVKVDLVQPKY